MEKKTKEKVLCKHINSIGNREVRNVPEDTEA